MSTKRSAEDELVSRLLLDVKALALINVSDASLRTTVRTSLLQSDDEQVRRFVKMVQSRKRTAGIGTLAIAVGELVLASFLAVAGIITFAPAMMGVDTPQKLVLYFSETLSAPLSSIFFTPVLPFLEFAFSVVLVIAAFYTLRQASVELQEAGMTIESNGGT